MDMAEDENALRRKRMVAEQIEARGIQDARVLAAISKVPRHRFMPLDGLAEAYADSPYPIGYEQTISQPYIVALMTELLELRPAARVLEIGTGSGYQAAVLGEITADVHTVEIVPELARQAGETLASLGYTHVHVHAGDGSGGWLEGAPYNGILVAASAPDVPRALLDQLAESGLLVIPVGERNVQQLEVWRRTGQTFERQVDLQVCFVPLRGEFGWK